MIGPTLVSMETLLDTNVEALSWSVTGIAIGNLIGAVTCAVTFDLFNKEIQLTAAALVEGCACVALPFMQNIYGYLAMVTLMFCGHGFMNSGKCIVWRICSSS